MNGVEPLHEARHGDRTRADMKLLGGRAEIRLNGVEIKLVLRPFHARCMGEKIIETRPAALPVKRHQESAAANRGKHEFRHAGCRHAGNRCIEGIAAVTQYVSRRFRRDLMAGCDDSLLPTHGSLVTAGVPGGNHAS